MYNIRAATFEVLGRCLLHPTTLTLASGKVYGLIGHHGLGKPTLLCIRGGSLRKGRQLS